VKENVARIDWNVVRLLTAEDIVPQMQEMICNARAIFDKGQEEGCTVSRPLDRFGGDVDEMVISGLPAIRKLRCGQPGEADRFRTDAAKFDS
jgi:hypothetical protein